MQTFLQDKLEKFVDKLDLANECNILAELEKNAAYKRLADEVSRILIIMGRDAILKRENYTMPYIQKLIFLRVPSASSASFSTLMQVFL